MYTQKNFSDIWRNIHSKMDVEAEIPYYYDCYRQLLAASNAPTDNDNICCMNLVRVLLYVEDMGGLQLGKWYMENYRMSSNWLDINLQSAGLNFSHNQDVAALIDKFIENSPESGMVRYVRDTIQSLDFEELCSFILWQFKYNLGFADCLPGDAKDQYLNEEVFHSDNTEFLYNYTAIDNALCWKDKGGKTIIQRLIDCFPNKPQNMEVRNNLLALRTHNLDAYRIKEVLENGEVIIGNYKKTISGKATLPIALPEDYNDSYLVGILVEWDKWHFATPYTWIPKYEMVGYDRERVANGLQEYLMAEAEGCRADDVVGNSIDVYSDLFVV